MKIKEFINSCEIKSDELGRVIIHDMKILDKINGALFGGAEFMIPDAACGNDNCVC